MTEGELLAELERERSIRATAEEVAESSRHFDWSVALAKSEIEVHRLREQLAVLQTQELNHDEIEQLADELSAKGEDLGWGWFDLAMVASARAIGMMRDKALAASEVTETSPEPRCKICGGKGHDKDGECYRCEGTGVDPGDEEGERRRLRLKWPAPVAETGDQERAAWKHKEVTSPKHGVTCPKRPHIGDGYLHAEDDDSPFDVDGMSYCGRCHRYI